MTAKVDQLYAPLYEGGDEPAPAEADKKLSKEERKLAKYKNDTAGFSVKDAHPGLANGEIGTDRKCTDIFCLIFFIIAIIAWIGVAVMGFTNGNVLKLLAPIDQNSLICGHNTTNAKGTTYDYAEDYKYLYLTDLLDTSPFESGWCVKECPSLKTSPIDFMPYPGKTAPKVIGGQYATTNVLGYCLPTSAKDLSASQQVAYKSIKASLLNNPVGAAFNNMKKASTSIYIGMAMSIVWSLVFIYVISAFAETIAWGIIIATNVGLFAAGAMALLEYKDKLAEPSSDSLTNKPPTEYLVIGIVILIVACIMLCMVCCGMSQLKTAIDVVDASADFTKKTKRILCVSVSYFILQMIIFIIWCFSVACLWSWGDIRVDSIEHQSKETFFAPGQKNKFYYALFFMIFMIVWILEWISAKVNFITMYSASTYYFTSNANVDGEANVGDAFKAAYVYHAGSLAFGSFIIALVKILDFIVMTLCEYALKSTGDNAAAKLLVRCAECCMSCIEKVVDYINKSAYAYMAVTGDSFCSSAWSSFLLQLKHGLGFTFAKFLAEMFILVGKIFITLFNVAFTYALMKYAFKDFEGDDAITSANGPLVVVALVTYLCTVVFLGLFDETVLALMTCVCIDIDTNEEPKFGPPTFHDALGRISEGKKEVAPEGKDANEVV